MNIVLSYELHTLFRRAIKSQAVALALGKDKVERYIAKGRPLEAQGARSVVRIMWQSFMEHSDIDTGWGEL